jgi:hypothetical protein
MEHTGFRENPETCISADRTRKTMKRPWLALVAIVLGLTGVACADTGVGDPCSPARPPPTPPANTTCRPGQGCFVDQEIYLETRSLQCRTRVCMVWRWDEARRPEQESQRVFCTVKSNQDAECPTEFSCVTAIVAGDPGIRGKYCVRSSLVSM